MDSSKLILEHVQDDLTVTVDAKLTLSDLQATLANHGQFFPFFHPNTQTLAIGEILSTAPINFLSYRYGHLRDLTLGLSVRLADGTFIKGGGKVVKNVSGYEMPKLFIGAFGTLGTITAATLRLSPIPQSQFIFKAEARHSYSVLQILKKLFLSKLILTFAILRRDSKGIQLLIRVDGAPRFVHDQVEKTKMFLEGLTEMGELSSEQMEDHLSFGEDSITCQGFIPPSSFRNLESEVEVTSQSHGWIPTLLLSMDGAFRVGWTGSFNEEAVSAFQGFNRRVASLGGWIRYQRIPEALRIGFPTWGEERPEWKISRRLKELFGDISGSVPRG